MSGFSNLQLRKGTEAEWTLVDPVLLLGEPAYSTDVNGLKVGNGVDVWSDLSYIIGPQGPPGADGADGADGVVGSVWYSDTADPAGPEGNDLDLWLNTTTGDVFQKFTGVWTLQGNILGPTGAAGADGTDGTDGTDGADGAPGADGADGTSWTPIYVEAAGACVSDDDDPAPADGHVATSLDTDTGIASLWTRAGGEWYQVELGGPITCGDPPAFSPPDVAGLEVWHDFSDASLLFTDAGSTNVTSDGDAIYQANDANGNQAAIQTGSSERPLYKTGIINGLSVARFDNTDDWISADTLTNACSLPITYFAVVKLLAASAQQAVMMQSSSGYLLMYRRTSGGNWGMYNGTESPDSGVLANTSPNVVVCQFNGASSKMWVNGGTAATGNPSTATDPLTAITYGIRSGIPSNMDLGEALVYDAAVADADINLVGNYLATKWGTTWTDI